MSIKRFVLLVISHVPTLIWAQASYMHEISEDTLIDKGNDSISTFLGFITFLFFGIALLIFILIGISNLFSNNSSHHHNNCISNDKYIKFWSEKQSRYLTECWKTKKNYLKKWGCSIHKITYPVLFKTEKYEICQLFPHAFSLQNDIDYGNLYRYKDIGERLSKEFLYYNYEESIINDLSFFFFRQLEPYSIIYCERDNVKYKNNDNNQSAPDFTEKIMKHFHLKDGNDYISVPYCWLKDLDNEATNLKGNIIIIDLITDNNRLQIITLKILSKLKDNYPCITYISIYKEYDKNEMMKIVEKTKTT